MNRGLGTISASATSSGAEVRQTGHVTPVASVADGRRYVILGAGPTGLGAAHRLRELGVDNFHVYDRADRVGGLAASFVDDAGFTWDIGGHVQFSHYAYFDRLMGEALGDRWLHHERESWVWVEGRFVPYPFQNNLRHLPDAPRWRCVQGLVQLYRQGGGTGRPENFGQWIDATFGAGIAEVFMRPYNFKVWAHPPEAMDYGWIGERVAVTDLERVLDNILHDKDDVSWGPNNTFQFPERGGTGAIWEAVADRVGRAAITLNRAVTEIDTDAKRVHFDDGSEDRYDRLITTLPLDRLVRLTHQKPLIDPADRLLRSASNIVGVGLSGRPPAALSKKCWMYFPESDCPFYRVTVFSNYSPNNVPDINSQWSLMAEVSESVHKPVDVEHVIRDTVAGLRATGLIHADHEVLSTWHHRAHHGYPVPGLGRDAALAELQPALEARDVFSRGRFGGWKYEVSNQDHSLMQGVELVDRLLLGVPEVTYRFPGTANNLTYAK